MTVYPQQLVKKPSRVSPFTIQWLRARQDLDFNRPKTFFAMGIRGSGKSMLLEQIGTEFLFYGHKIIDLFGSRDGEGLAWLRSPYSTDDNTLLLHGDNIDVTCKWDEKKASNFTIADMQKYDIVVSSSPLYNGFSDEFTNAGHITDRISFRYSWKQLYYLIAREASSLYYSRLKIADNQIEAKNQMVYLLREARHMGIALGLDTLRYYAIDIDIRKLSDYTFIKSQGVDGLSDEIKFLYKYFKTSLIRNMKPQNFALLTINGSIGYGTFPELSWHKKENENLLELLDIKLEYSEPIRTGEDRRTYRTIGDVEHTKIIEQLDLGKGMHTIAESMKHSTQTIQAHKINHNAEVKQQGFCSACRRAKSDYQERIIA